jgi:hypothetical protein
MDELLSVMHKESNDFACGALLNVTCWLAVVRGCWELKDCKLLVHVAGAEISRRQLKTWYHGRRYARDVHTRLPRPLYRYKLLLLGAEARSQLQDEHEK